MKRSPVNSPTGEMSQQQGNMSQDMFEESPVDDQKAASQEVAWRGIPLNELNVRKQFLYPHVHPSFSHTVLFKLPVKSGSVPSPYPEKSSDYWDNNHVRMPYSPKSLYPVSDTELKARWLLMKQALGRPITTSISLESAIFSYNSKYSQKWKFDALHKLFTETLDEAEAEYFFKTILPGIINLALSLPDKIHGGLPLLKKHSARSVSLTQDQVSSLMANAFLCTFPRRNSTAHYTPFPSINFNRLFQCGDLNSVQEKLKCFINYFRRVIGKKPEGVITYSRNFVDPIRLPNWSECNISFPKLHISSKGTIEDDGTGMMEIDFANKFVGGGVLGRGSVQEEIKFLICPELIVSRLITECLDDTEALIVTGCERFNRYFGYADTFMWAGDFNDSSERDPYGRKCCTVVAIDATHYSSTNQQYTVQSMVRELNKAYSGFSFGSNEGWDISVATGNWGCGAFNGDPRLKALLQLMAAAAAKKNLAYFTFQDDSLRDSIYSMYMFLVNSRTTVGDLWKVLAKFSEVSNKSSLYDFIYDQLRTSADPVKRISEPPSESQCDESMNFSEGEVSLTESEVAEAIKCANIIEQNCSATCVRDPVPAETYSIKTEEGRKRCIETEKQRWQAYEIAQIELRPLESSTPNISGSNITGSSTPKTAVKRKISDYFTNDRQ